jgi:hypothetical protein
VTDVWKRLITKIMTELEIRRVEAIILGFSSLVNGRKEKTKK